MLVPTVKLYHPEKGEAVVAEAQMADWLKRGYSETPPPAPKPSKTEAPPAKKDK